MPLKANTVSVSTAPTKSSPACRPIVGDHRQQGVAQDVPPRIVAAGETLGLGGPDVVLVHHLRDRGAG